MSCGSGRARPRFLKRIADDAELYGECDVAVKQQIWAVNDELFVQAVDPVLDEYVDEKERILTVVGRTSTNFFTCDTTKTRRQWKTVKRECGRPCASPAQS